MAILTKRELAQRRRGVGASDAPAILGVDPHRTALDVWGEKVGIDVGTRQVGDAVTWGDELEPLIVRRYARDHDVEVVYPVARVQKHPKVPILFASPDALVRSPERRLVEAKVDRYGRGYGDPGTDEVPLNVKVQVLQQLEVTAYDVATVAVLVGGTDYREYEIEASRVRQDALVAAIVEWWDLYVFTRTPPAEDPREFARYIRGRHPRDSGEELVAAAMHEELVELWRESLVRVREAEGEALRYENAIRAAMGNASRLLGSFGRIDWKKTRDGTRTDWKLVAADLRKLVEAQALGTLPVTDDPLQLAEAIESIHTVPRPGSRTFRPYWKNATPALPGENGDTPDGD